MKTLNGMIASQDTKRQMLINISVFCSNYFGNEINVGDINTQLAEEGEPPLTEDEIQHLKQN